MDLATGIALAEKLLSAVVKAAPLIQQGIVDATPYAKALGGMLAGTNATQAEVDALIAKLEEDSAKFDQPMPDEKPEG